MRAVLFVCVLACVAIAGVHASEVEALTLSESAAERLLDNTWLEEFHAEAHSSRGRFLSKVTPSQALQPAAEQHRFASAEKGEPIRPVTCTPAIVGTAAKTPADKKNEVPGWKACVPPTPVLTAGKFPQAPVDKCDNVYNMIQAATPYKTSFDQFMMSFRDAFLKATGAKATDVELALAPLKGYYRAREKADLKYGGDARSMGDLVRGGFYYRSLDLLNKGVCQFRDFVAANKGWSIVEAEDKFAKPQDGYSDYNFKLRYNGLNMELQMNTCAMMNVKEVAHKMYEKTRSGTLTATEVSKINADMLTVFKGAADIDPATCAFPKPH